MSTAIRTALLRHYDRHARDLPWRRTRDPYAVWVSEIMLQQTRVDTVIDYYERFMRRFPTPDALAEADPDDVMAAWSGLGYYRRAHLLHAGVREVVAHYGGQVPRDPDARRALPGVGRYTAGAIGSIAFDLPEPLVDGNVARVLCRLHGIDTPLGRTDTEAQLWQHAEALAAGPRPGALNQALMELGATLCSKQRPHCTACPLRTRCRAHAEGRTAELPVPRPRKPPRPVAMVALRARAPRTGAGGLWLRRGDHGLFAGLWNLPMAEGSGRDAARALLRTTDLSGRLGAQPIGQLEHVLTHRRLRVEVWPVSAARPRRGARIDPEALRPVDGGKLEAVGLSALTRKALSL